MKRLQYSSLLVVLMTLFAINRASAQDDDLYIGGQNAMYWYEKSDFGRMEAFLDMDIRKVCFSCRDEEGRLHDYPVSQVIHTADSVYVIPLEQIDSIGLFTPAPKMNPKLFVLDEDLEPYVVSVSRSSHSFVLSTDSPRFPENGQVVFTTYPGGVMADYAPVGKVAKIETTSKGIRYYLDIFDFKLTDIYETLVTTSSQIDMVDDEGNKQTLRVSSAPEGGENIFGIRRAKGTLADAAKDPTIRDVLKDPSKSWSEKFAAIKKIIANDITFDGDNIIDGITMTYHGWTKNYPKDYPGNEKKYPSHITFGLRPSLTVKIPIETNIQIKDNNNTKDGDDDNKDDDAPKDGDDNNKDDDASKDGDEDKAYYEYINIGVHFTLSAWLGFEAVVDLNHDQKDKTSQSIKDKLDSMLAEDGKGKFSEEFEPLGIPFSIRPFGFLHIEFTPFLPIFEYFIKSELELSVKADFTFGFGAEFNWTKFRENAARGLLAGFFNPALSLAGILGECIDFNYIKPTLSITPTFKASGSIDFFAGLAPTLKIGIVDVDLCCFELQGKFGGYLKGNVEFNGHDPFERTPFGDFINDHWIWPADFESGDLVSDYDNYIKDKNHLEAGFRTGVTAKFIFGNKFKDDDGVSQLLHQEIEIPLRSFFNSVLPKSDLSVKGLDLSDGDLSIDFPVISGGILPDFQDFNVSTPSEGIKFSYLLRRHTFTSNYYGVAVVDLDNPDPKNRFYSWSKSKYGGLTSGIQKKFEFTMNLPAGRNYAAYPVYWDGDLHTKPWEYTDLEDPEEYKFFDSHVMYASPYATFLSSPVMDAGEVELTPYNYAYVKKWDCKWYENPEHALGVALIDAGQLTSGTQEVRMEDQDPKKLDLFFVEKQYRRSIAEGYYDNKIQGYEYPGIKIAGLKPGHRYYYSLFYSVQNENDAYGGNNLKINAFSEAKSFVTEGNGMSLEALEPLSVGPDFVRARGCLTWFNEAPLDISQYQLIMNLSDKNGETEIHIDPTTIVNGHIFEVYVDKLDINKDYTYYFSIEGKEGAEDKITSHYIKFHTEENASRKLPSLKDFKWHLVGISGNSASFEMMADWEPEPDDQVEIGIMYYRNMPNKPTEADLVYTNEGKKLFKDLIKKNKDWNDGVQKAPFGGGEIGTNYASKRGKWVTVQLKNLYPENNKYPDRIYYYRPYFCISNSTTKGKRMSSELDNYDMALPIGGTIDNPDVQKLIAHGSMSTFATAPGTQKVEHYNVSPPEWRNGSYWYSAQTLGTYAKNETGIVFTNGKEELINGLQGTYTVKGKMTKEKPASKMPERVVSYAPDEEIDDESYEINYDTDFQVDDLSKFIKNEKYKMCSFFETSDGRILYSDEIEFTYDDEYLKSGYDEVAPTPQPGDMEAGVAVDLGYTDDDGNPGPLWCSLNLGATNDKLLGNYYAWGETQPKTSYTEENYTWPFGDFSAANNIAGGILDAAHVNLGDDWRLPTEKEFRTLLEKCNVSWVVSNGYSCLRVTSPTNGNFILLPACGNKYGQRTYSQGTGGCYWTADCPTFVPSAEMTDIYDDDKKIDPKKAVEHRDATRFHFIFSKDTEVSAARCYFGRSIRPVKDKK